MQAFITFTLFALFVRLSAFVPGDVPELSDPDWPIRGDEVDDLFDQLLSDGSDEDDENEDDTDEDAGA